MKESEKEELKEKVEAGIRALDLEIPILKEQTRPVKPDNAIGRLTRMEAINSKSISEASLRSLEAKMTGYKWVLANIDDPDFGLCTECGGAIPVKRIMLVPENPRCVGCAGG